MPIPEKDEDMPKYNWVKELMYEKILADARMGGRIKVVELDFYANAHTCGTCRSSEYVWIQVPSYHYAGGVIASCSRCRRTWGPLGERYASGRGERDITAAEAIEICLRTKQSPPPLLKTAYQQSELEKAREKAGKRPRPPRVS